MTAIRDRWVAEKRDAGDRLGNLRLTEIVPSRRDFLQFVTTQKQGVALVARVQRRNPETGGEWPLLDPTAFARRCDDADVGAIAVRTAGLFDTGIADLAAVAQAVTAPVLRDDLCLSRAHVYEARLHGADAILLPADVLSADELRDFDAIATSMHMAVIIDAASPQDVERALAIPTACIGLRGALADGHADMAAMADLSRHIPPRRTVLLLSEVRRLDDLRDLAGNIDAAVVGDALLDVADPAGAIGAFLNAMA